MRLNLNPDVRRPHVWVDRFWQRVRKTDGCWEWTGCKTMNGEGYGTLSLSRVKNSRTWYAHRLSWLLHYGPVPQGLRVLHKCDNPKCVNPDHLFLGTPKDNMRDMVEKGRHHGARRITPEMIATIKAESGKIPQKDLAVRFGIHRCTVWAIQNDKRRLKYA